MLAVQCAAPAMDPARKKQLFVLTMTVLGIVAPLPLLGALTGDEALTGGNAALAWTAFGLLLFETFVWMLYFRSKPMRGIYSEVPQEEEPHSPGSLTLTLHVFAFSLASAGLFIVGYLISVTNYAIGAAVFKGFALIVGHVAAPLTQ